MYEFWDNISYTVELLISCLIVMHPLRKRGHYVLRFSGAAAVFLAASYFYNSAIGSPNEGVGMFLYWTMFLVACIPVVRFCTGASMNEVVFCVICASALQHITYDIYMVISALWAVPYVILFAIYVGAYFLFYRIFVQKLVRNGRYLLQKSDLVPMGTIILFVLLLTLLERAENPTQKIVYHLSDALCCIYVLWQQVSQREKLDLQQELDGINSAWRQQQAQFQITQDTIDTINRKCHDLRHQIKTLLQSPEGLEGEEYLRKIDETINIYDTALKTGNTALDVVLMEKGLFCQSHDIQWTCMADGSKLNFMELEDIYAMFGNALDNAISAVMELEEPEKRIISVRVITQERLLMIQIQNYHNRTFNFEGGLPLTTQKDKIAHGYGMKSIRYTAEKYNGTISVKVDHETFMLQILLPWIELHET